MSPHTYHHGKRPWRATRNWRPAWDIICQAPMPTMICPSSSPSTGTVPSMLCLVDSIASKQKNIWEEYEVMKPTHLLSNSDFYIVHPCMWSTCTEVALEDSFSLFSSSSFVAHHFICLRSATPFGGFDKASQLMTFQLPDTHEVAHEEPEPAVVYQHDIGARPSFNRTPIGWVGSSEPSSIHMELDTLPFDGETDDLWIACPTDPDVQIKTTHDYIQLHKQKT